MEISPHLAAILFGVLEGLTEFLPVSSTGHLIIAQEFLNFSDPGNSLTIMIQLGAICALLVVFFQKIISTIIHLPTSSEARHFTLAVISAFLPAAVLGLLFYDLIRSYFFGTSVVITMLIVGGLVMIWLELRPQSKKVIERIEDIDVKKAFIIGCCQALAMIPGTSRSGATIVGGLLLGLDRKVAAEFSFFLSIPTMIGAFTLAAWKNRDNFTMDQLELISIGFVVSFVVALLVVRIFLAIISRIGYIPFAIYRLLLGGVLLLFALT